MQQTLFLTAVSIQVLSEYVFPECVVSEAKKPKAKSKLRIILSCLFLHDHEYKVGWIKVLAFYEIDSFVSRLPAQ